MNNVPRIIYLDQNKWIDLASAEKKGEMSDILDAIKSHVKDGEWIFPLSHVHLMETAKKRDDRQRRELAEFMAKISAGWHISPFTEVSKKEFEICITNGNPLSRSEVIFGEWPMIKKIPNTIRELIPNLDFAYIVESAHNGNLCLNNGLRNNKYFEELRLDFLRFPSSKREQIYIARYLTAILLQCNNGLLHEVLNTFDPDDDGLTIYDHYFLEKNKNDELIKQMPALYCECKFNFQLIGKQDTIKEHDFNDIVSFCVAIPYCDVIIAEKRWGNTAINPLKLDKIFGKTIGKSIDILKQLT